MIDSLVAQIEARHAEVQQQMADPEIIGDRQKFAEAGRLYNQLAPAAKLAEEWRRAVDDAEGAQELLTEGGEDPEMRAMLDTARARIGELEEEIRLAMVERDPSDDKNVIVEIRGGAGGEEAGLWAGDLYRMFLRYAERRGFKTETMNASDGSYTFEIRGDGAYSVFKFEGGTHRVQRVPETESQGRIHTSTATVAVLPEAEEVDVQIDQNDLEIDVYRSSGPGGQSVNTTDSAVRITHKPTGIVVSMQDEKSQLQNRERAMKVLRARLYEAKLAEQQAELAAARSAQVGTGERAEKIRTYNFPERRVTDHRIKLTVHNLDQLLAGELDEFTAALQDDEKRHAGGARLRLACGGHPLPLVVRASGAVDAVGKLGTLLGADVEPVVSDVDVDLGEGDLLVLYTDGVTEVRAGRREIFGHDDLAELLAGCAGMPPDAVAERVQDAVLTAAGGRPRDDIAILVIGPRVHPAPPILAQSPALTDPRRHQVADPDNPDVAPASEASAASALLRELVAHLRQNRTVLREEWARRITEAQLLTALTPEEIFSEATSVYDNYVEVLETGSVEALQDYARNLSERIIPRGVETDEVLGIVLLLRDVLARSLFEKYQDDFNRVLDAYEPAANRIANTVAINFVQERERVIRQQQEAIRELSTPVLQVRERLLILPIIGVLDSQRARQLTEQLLRGIRANRAKVVVIDITGVPTIDSTVANHLVQTVEASRLMGASVIITGLSSEIAQTLVTIGVDLSKVNAVGDLQGGIEEAERLLGYEVLRGAETPQVEVR